MKVIVNKPVELNVDFVKVFLPVRYPEDVAEDFPFKNGDDIIMNIKVDTGEIIGWPESYGPCKLYLKVVDEGCYALFNEVGILISKMIGEYVPHGLIPGEYGDYVDFDINEKGVITNWNKKPDLKEFFK